MRGRKPSPSSRNHMFHVRMSDAEFYELERKASSLSMTPCDFVRMLIENYRVKRKQVEE